MPIQVKRLLLVFAIFIGIMLVLVYYYTPDSFGEYGHYRGKALDEISAKDPKYMQMETCAMCHDSIAGVKAESVHKSIQCETCHGPGNKHVDDPENVKMDLPMERELCLRCHMKNLARPSGVIVQIDNSEHYVDEQCITCHNPHQP